MKNLKEIKKGTFNANFPIADLVQSSVNRDTVSKHSDNFAKKLKNYGWLSPVIIDEKGNIIEGHHRVLAAESLGVSSVPVYITEWVDTSNLDTYQKYIISLNNSNRAWSALDYLKSFSRNKKDYSFVYDKFIECKEVFSVGNVLNIYFNSGSSQAFKEGRSSIKNKEFSEYLFKELKRLRSNYGSKKFQAVTINRVTSFSHAKIKSTIELDYILSELEELAKQDSAYLSSVEHLNGWLRNRLTTYKNLKK